MNTFIDKLAQFVDETNYEDLSEKVIEEAKRRILDVVGIGLSGYTTIPGKQITKFIKKYGKEGSSILWGSGYKVSPEYASLANGTMVFNLELDDVHRTSHTHPGVSSIPTAFALCEELELSGKDLITATVVGYEIGIRIGLALSPSIYVDRPLLAPGTLSIFSAAATSAKLYGYSLKEIVGILGTSAYISPLSPFETFKRGFSTKDIIMGWGNFTGILSAKLREFDFEGADTGIEGEFGYAKSVAEKYSFEKGLKDIGKDFLILKTGIKPYACCRQHHAAIDATLDIRNNNDISIENIKKITDQTFKVSSRGDNKRPSTIAEAKYSNPYIIATALIEGKAWREQFTKEKINDEKYLNLAAKVRVKEDKELDKLYDEKWPSRITIEMNNGEKYVSRRDLPKGEPEYPVSLKELKNKFMSLSQDTISQQHALEIWDNIMKMDKKTKVIDISKLLIERR